MIVLAAVILSAVGVPGPAQAQVIPSDNLGWTSCSWGWRDYEAGDRSIQYYVGTFPEQVDGFPADNAAPTNIVGIPQVAGGAQQSFVSRISEAASRWTTAMASSNRPLRVVRTFAPFETDLALRYLPVPGPDTSFLGYAFVRTRIMETITPFEAWLCLVQRSFESDPQPLVRQAFQIEASEIGIQHRVTWFTMPDTVRPQWETCPQANLSYAWLCSKDYDFGGVFLHELGHVLGIHHPETVDLEMGTLTGSQNAARCGVALDRATMCASFYFWESDRRTLMDSWDGASIRVHHANH